MFMFLLCRFLEHLTRWTWHRLCAYWKALLSLLVSSSDTAFSLSARSPVYATAHTSLGTSDFCFSLKLQDGISNCLNIKVLPGAITTAIPRNVCSSGKSFILFQTRASYRPRGLGLCRLLSQDVFFLISYCTGSYRRQWNLGQLITQFQKNGLKKCPTRMTLAPHSMSWP